MVDYFKITVNLFLRNFHGMINKILSVLSLSLISIIIFIPVSCCSFTLGSNMQEFTLKNGMKVILMQRSASPTVSFSMCFKTGAVDEQSGATGSAHLLEHMLFKGTTSIGTRNYKDEERLLRSIHDVGTALDKARIEQSPPDMITELASKLQSLQGRHKQLVIDNEIDAIYSRNGAEGLNAGTGFDVTSYKVSLPANRVELWARIESDRFTNPVFRQYYLERDVVLEELRQSYETKPERMLMTQLLAAAFTAHPYGRPIIGWKSDIEHLSIDRCMSFFKQHYSVSNAVVAIVGDLQFDTIRQLIERYFGSLPDKLQNDYPITIEPQQIGERRIQVLANAEPLMLVGYHKPTLPDPHDTVFDLIDCILSNGRTSRLYKSLVLDKKLAVSVETANGFPGARYPNLFFIKIIPAYKVEYSAIEKALYSELALLAQKPISAGELRKAKKQIRSDFIRRMQSNAELANLLSYYQTICGDWRYIERNLDSIEKITADDIRAVAQRYLTAQNRTIAFLTRDTHNE